LKKNKRRSFFDKDGELDLFDFDDAMCNVQVSDVCLTKETTRDALTRGARR
jgi:hypothetical protein